MCLLLNDIFLAEHPDAKNLTRPVQPQPQPPIQVEKRKPASKSTKATAKENMISKSVQGKMSSRAGRMILELSIFADQALLNLFLPYFSQETSDKEQQYVKFREVILAFVNAVRDLLVLSFELND